MWNMQEFGIQIELTGLQFPGQKSDLQFPWWRIKLTYLAILRCWTVGENQVDETNHVILLNGETSYTNDNVKTKVNTKHMKRDNDVTQFGVTRECARSLLVF